MRVKFTFFEILFAFEAQTICDYFKSGRIDYNKRLQKPLIDDHVRSAG